MSSTAPDESNWNWCRRGTWPNAYVRRALGSARSFSDRVRHQLAEDKETRNINGRNYVLEYPIYADVALIKARAADRWGNLVYRKTGRNFGPIMATAARCTIAQVDEIVELGELDPESVVTPGIFVQRVVQESRAWRNQRRKARSDDQNRATRRSRRSRWSVMKKLNRDQMAARIARDIPEGAYVNLGIGMPTLVANHLPAEREVILHSENGVLGMGPAPAPGEEDPDLINAGKQPVTLLKGGCYFHHADSFGMMRGGHVDICVMGAFQVSVTGDWRTGTPGVPTPFRPWGERWTWRSGESRCS